MLDVFYQSLQPNDYRDKFVSWGDVLLCQGLANLNDEIAGRTETLFL